MKKKTVLKTALPLFESYSQTQMIELVNYIYN